MHFWKENDMRTFEFSNPKLQAKIEHTLDCHIQMVDRFLEIG
jgi:hypothetical protein